MILKVVADPRAVMDDGDSHLVQPGRRADPGKLQDLRRADGAGRQDDLALGPRLHELPVLAELDADGAPALEDDFLDQNAGLELEVGSIEDRLQEGARRRPAHAAL